MDDADHELSELRRLLYFVSSSWKMFFVSSGEEALRVLSQNSIEVIVSDLLMPAMSGAELLAQVQALYPGVARLVMTDQPNPDSSLDVVRAAHQVLAKPADARSWTLAISGALSVQQSVTDPALRELIGGVTALPTLPAVYGQLASAISAEDVELSEIAAIVASDIAISTDVLKLVNSAFFGLPRAVYSIEEAVRLLGLDNVQALVLAGSLFARNEGLSWILDVEDVRDRSLRRAAIARAIAGREKMTGRAREIAVLSCLLRDVGRLVLAEGRPGDTELLARAVAAEPGTPTLARITELEIDAYGCSVPQASAYLLGLWGFAPAIVHTIAAQPLTEAHRGVTKFEWVLGFADAKAGAIDHDVTLPLNEYMTGERLSAWNHAAGAIWAP